MTELTTEQKKLFRQQCRQTRKALGKTARLQASQEICAQIENWRVFQRVSVVLTYMPIKSEVDLRPLLERYPEKRWLIPRIIPEADHSMRFHPYDPQRLVHHPFGMDEPVADLPAIPPNEIELALVPGLAFDRHGWRLGYGGGYFDRFLKDFSGTSLGIVYAALLLENLPHAEHDVPMNWVVNERELFSPQKSCA
jgi:5-formyltetrahydrofolate cyclo-ligase